MKLKGLFLPLAVIMMLLCACSNDKPLYETIPAESQLVVAVNGPELVKACDGAFKERPDVQEMLDFIKKCGASVDAGNMAAFITKSREMYVTAIVTDADGFEKALTDGGARKSSDGGFDLYQIKGYTVAVRGGQMWLTDGPVKKAPDAIKAILDKAGKKSIADIGGVCDKLGDNKLLTLALHMTYVSKLEVKDDSGLDNAWGTVTVEIKDNAITGNILAFNGKGEQPENLKIPEINLPVLQYVPDGSNIVTAFGVPSSAAHWDKVMDNLANAGLPAMQIEAVKMLLPYFKAIDGTVMAAVKIDEVNPGGVPACIAMIRMNQDMVNQTVHDILQFASQMCVVQQIGESLFMCSLDGMNVYVGNVDGYLTVSTFVPDNNNGSALAAKFSGKNGALIVDIPSLSKYGLNTPAGIDFSMTAGQTSGTYTLRLPGTDAPVMQTLMQIFMAL